MPINSEKEYEQIINEFFRLSAVTILNYRCAALLAKKKIEIAKTKGQFTDEVEEAVSDVEETIKRFEEREWLIKDKLKNKRPPIEIISTIITLNVNCIRDTLDSSPSMGTLLEYNSK